MSDKQKYVNSSLSGGTHKLKINSFELKKRSYLNKANNPIYDIIANVESEPVGGSFKGFKKDYNNPNSESYLGQVGRLKLSKFGFSDTTLDDGTLIIAEKDMLKSLKSLCMEIGQLNWFQAQDDKLPTAQALVDAINASNIFKDHYLYFVVASEQYLNKNKYVADDLYLPKYSSQNGKPFSKQTEDLIVFSSTIHVMKPKDAPVKNQTKMDLPTTNDALTPNGPSDDLPF